MRKWLPMTVLALVAVAVVGGIVLTLARRPGAPATPESATATTAASERVQISPRTGQVIRGDAPPAAGTAGPPGGATPREQAQASIERDLAALDAAFQRQPAAGGMAARQGRMQALLSDSRLDEARSKPASSRMECRAVQCRLTAEFAPGDDPADWMMRLHFAGAGLIGGSQQVREELPGGGVRLHAYFTPPRPSSPAAPGK